MPFVSFKTKDGTWVIGAYYRDNELRYGFYPNGEGEGSDKGRWAVITPPREIGGDLTSMHYYFDNSTPILRWGEYGPGTYTLDNPIREKMDMLYFYVGQTGCFSGLYIHNSIGDVRHIITDNGKYVSVTIDSETQVTVGGTATDKLRSIVRL